MHVSIAIQICKGYGDAHGISNFLDALQHMEKNRNYLSHISKKALDIVVAQGCEMFAPV
jgi:hypothetical protein